jgi:hypothetical protein
MIVNLVMTALIMRGGRALGSRPCSGQPASLFFIIINIDLIFLEAAGLALGSKPRSLQQASLWAAGLALLHHH